MQRLEESPAPCRSQAQLVVRKACRPVAADKACGDVLVDHDHRSGSRRLGSRHRWKRRRGEGPRERRRRGRPGTRRRGPPWSAGAATLCRPRSGGRRRLGVEGGAPRPAPRRYSCRQSASAWRCAVIDAVQRPKPYRRATLSPDRTSSQPRSSSPPPTPDLPTPRPPAWHAHPALIRRRLPRRNLRLHTVGTRGDRRPRTCELEWATLSFLGVVPPAGQGRVARPQGLASGCRPRRRDAPRTAVPVEASAPFAPVPQEPGTGRSTASSTRRSVHRHSDRNAYRPGNAAR